MVWEQRNNEELSGASRLYWCRFFKCAQHNKVVDNVVYEYVKAIEEDKIGDELDQQRIERVRNQKFSDMIERL